MCECNCGDFNYEQAHKVGENILAIQVYDGCENCGNPVGVILHLMTAEEAHNWKVQADEEFKPDKWGSAEVHMPIVHQTDLVAAARSEEFREIHGDIDLSEYDSLDDVLEDCGLTLLQIAIGMTLAKQRNTEQADTPEE